MIDAWRESSTGAGERLVEPLLDHAGRLTSAPGAPIFPETLRGAWMSREPDELLRGTLDALILKTLTWGPRHGYGIARWIRDTSRRRLAVEDRALYLALHRLEDRGLVESAWGLSDNNRRARFYQLTTRGRAALRAESKRLARYAAGLFRVLKAPGWTAR